jgi:hypothetical protein
MPGIRTSSAFYRRGVPNAFSDFAKIAAANYTIFQPTRPLFDSSFFRKSISNFIVVSR